MESIIKGVEIDSEALEPTLKIFIDIIYDNGSEAPISISGRIRGAGGKIIAYLNECYRNSNDNSIICQPPLKKNGHQRNDAVYTVQLTASLSAKAIDDIEEAREKGVEKNVYFNFDFVIKGAEIISHASEPIRISIQTYRAYGHYIIKQSDWIQKFATPLGIGNFILFEFPIPNKEKVSNFWLELYTNCSEILREMEDRIKHGDWQGVMDRGRQFYEILKIGDGKPEHKKFEDELILLFKKDQHNDEGIQNFLDSIWQFFEYISKFIHAKDKKGGFKSRPLATKQDAYFAFILGVGLLNLLSSKIRNE